MSSSHFLEPRTTAPIPSSCLPWAGQAATCRRPRLWLPERRLNCRRMSPWTPKWTGHDRRPYFLQARLNVSLPGIDRETAQKLVDGAEAVAGDLLEPADVYHVVTGCWRVCFACPYPPVTWKRS